MRPESRLLPIVLAGLTLAGCFSHATGPEGAANAPDAEDEAPDGPSPGSTPPGPALPGAAGPAFAGVQYTCPDGTATAAPDCPREWRPETGAFTDLGLVDLPGGGLAAYFTMQRPNGPGLTGTDSAQPLEVRLAATDDPLQGAWGPSHAVPFGHPSGGPSPYDQAENVRMDAFPDVVAAPDGTLYALADAGEMGVYAEGAMPTRIAETHRTQVFRSGDLGATWEALAAPAAGNSSYVPRLGLAPDGRLAIALAEQEMNGYDHDLSVHAARPGDADDAVLRRAQSGASGGATLFCNTPSRPLFTGTQVRVACVVTRSQQAAVSAYPAGAALLRQDPENGTLVSTAFIETSSGTDPFCFQASLASLAQGPGDDRFVLAASGCRLAKLAIVEADSGAVLAEASLSEALGNAGGEALDILAMQPDPWGGLHLLVQWTSYNVLDPPTEPAGTDLPFQHVVLRASDLSVLSVSALPGLPSPYAVLDPAGPLAPRPRFWFGAAEGLVFWTDGPAIQSHSFAPAFG